MTITNETAILREIDGADLEARWFGDRRVDRRDIVLLHEGLGSVSAWRGFPEDLARATGRGVFAYSRRGYGASSPLVGPREPDYMHREARVVLPAVLAAAGISRPILFGHSDGGSIALLFAAAFPDQTAGLVLEAPHVFVEPLTLDSIAKVKTIYETTDLRARLGRHHADADKAFWSWNHIWLDPRFRDWNIEAGLEAITCPTLMIQGLDDEYGTRAQLDAIVDRVTQARILMLESCGHAPHRDSTLAVLQSTASFTRSLN